MAPPGTGTVQRHGWAVAGLLPPGDKYDKGDTRTSEYKYEYIKKMQRAGAPLPRPPEPTCVLPPGVYLYPCLTGSPH